MIPMCGNTADFTDFFLMIFPCYLMSNFLHYSGSLISMYDCTISFQGSSSCKEHIGKIYFPVLAAWSNRVDYP